MGIGLKLLFSMLIVMVITAVVDLLGIIYNKDNVYHIATVAFL